MEEGRWSDLAVSLLPGIKADGRRLCIHSLFHNKS